MKIAYKNDNGEKKLIEITGCIDCPYLSVKTEYIESKSYRPCIHINRKPESFYKPSDISIWVTSGFPIDCPLINGSVNQGLRYKLRDIQKQIKIYETQLSTEDFIDDELIEVINDIHAKFYTEE